MSCQSRRIHIKYILHSQTPTGRTHSHISSIRENRLHHVHIIQLPTTRINRLEQLINLLITHLLAQIRQNIPELAHADKTRQILIKHLEAAAVFLRLAGVAEAARAVEDAREGVKVDYPNMPELVAESVWAGRVGGGWVLLTVRADLLLEIADFRQCGILSTCAQEVAEGVEGDAAVAAFVEEGEGFLEVGRLRLFFRHRVRIAVQLMQCGSCVLLASCLLLQGLGMCRC